MKTKYQQRLTDEQAQAIIHEAETGQYTYTQLAKKWGINNKSVRYIVTGRTYPHLTRDPNAYIRNARLTPHQRQHIQLLRRMYRKRTLASLWREFYPHIPYAKFQANSKPKV